MKRVLVVDDDVGILETLKEILMLEGYEVTTAETGQAGLDEISKTFFNLAVFDIKLPDMEGTELLERAHKIRPGMKKIMVTGYASLENSVRSLNSGADAYILKPVDPDVLIRTVGEKIAEQEKEKEFDEEKVSEFLEERLLGIKR